jgi:predicted GIY-YIG superfamily endonuclease
MPHPQTIQIFLPSADPQGIRIASITTRIVQVIEIPRVQLAAFLEMPEASHVGVYVLVGIDEDTGAERAYIGQTGEIGKRLKQHNDSKDFWNRALVAISLTRSLTVTHAHFLEWLALSKANLAKRYMLENGTAGTKPHTPAPMEAECNEIFETVDVLMTTLGYPMFKPLVSRLTLVDTSASSVTHAASPIGYADVELVCLAPGVDAKLKYTDEGVVILKGSYGKAAVSESLAKLKRKADQRKLDILLGELRIEGDRAYVETDMLFRSPSGASDYLFGRPSNGWTEIKGTDGRTLSEIAGRKTGQSSGG